MAQNVKLRGSVFLIVLGMILTACSQTPEPTAVPTLDPKSAVAEEPAATPISEVVEKIIVINNSVLVENYIVQKQDETAGEIEIVVQGTLSNSCMEIEDATATNKGDVFLINIQTTFTDAGECEDGAFQFQEVVTLDTKGLSTGSYLISCGAVERFELTTEVAAPDTEDTSQGTSDETASLEETATAEGGDTAGEGDTAEGTTPDETAATDTTADPTGTGECEDYATFLSDVTYPDNTVVQAGETFTKTWEIRNDGSCTWGPGYALVGVSGLFSEVTPVEDPFPTVEPSESVELSLVLTAPQDLGVTSGAWVIERAEEGIVQIQNGENFDLWAIVEVGRASAVDIVSPVITVDETRVFKDGQVCAEANADYDNQVLFLINVARTNNGLTAYQVDTQLTAAARALTSDMACNDFSDHIGSDGSSWYDRITAQGYVYIDASENIYFGLAGVPEKAFNWWMDRSIHRGNILNSEFTEIGIAFALNPQTGGSYYTLVFALPEVEE